MAIKEVSEKRYDEMLGIVPPSLWLAKGFLVGEISDFRRCKITGQTKPTYAAFFSAYGRFYESEPLTEPEFWSFKIEDLPAPK